MNAQTSRFLNHLMSPYLLAILVSREFLDMRHLYINHLITVGDSVQRDAYVRGILELLDTCLPYM